MAAAAPTTKPQANSLQIKIMPKNAKKHAKIDTLYKIYPIFAAVTHRHTVILNLGIFDQNFKYWEILSIHCT
jgi:hypothetical protein